MPVVAVEIRTMRGLAFVELEASWIKAGANPDIRAIRPVIARKQLTDGERPGGFIAVYSRRNVNALSGAGDGPAQGENLQFVSGRNQIDGPAVACSKFPHFAEQRNYVDALTEVSAIIFSEPLHHCVGHNPPAQAKLCKAASKFF